MSDPSGSSRITVTDERRAPHLTAPKSSTVTPTKTGTRQKLSVETGPHSGNDAESGKKLTSKHPVSFRGIHRSLPPPLPLRGLRSNTKLRYPRRQASTMLDRMEQEWTERVRDGEVSHKIEKEVRDGIRTARIGEWEEAEGGQKQVNTREAKNLILRKGNSSAETHHPPHP